MTTHRSWAFTINNHTYDDLDRLIDYDAGYKYMVIGFEIGSKGTKHIQGFVQYYSPVRLTQVQQLAPRAHIEYTKGTPQQNINYCKEDGDYYELGYPPTEGGKVTFEQVSAAFKDPENNMTIIRQYGRAFNEVKQLKIQQSTVKTKFYIQNPKLDMITELVEYFGEDIPEFTIVTELSQLGGYEPEDIHTVVLVRPVMDQLIYLYARGVPIKYKYGYEYRTVKPVNFVLVTDMKSDNFIGYKVI